jgi:hypothetical protein
MAVMPMLDEQEFADVSRLHGDGIRSVKEYRERTGSPLQNVLMENHFASMLARYEAITGFKETNPNAVLHHRLSLYGPLCANCGKPLRSPKAKRCASCGAARV